MSIAAWRAKHRIPFIEGTRRMESHKPGRRPLSADVTAGVVYILRNPLDVATSYSHHYGINIEKAVGNYAIRPTQKLNLMTDFPIN